MYSPNPQVAATIDKLLSIERPPIPVAPAQDPRKEWCHRVIKDKDGVELCPLDTNLNPIRRFTGKNPSRLKRDGSARSLLHGDFQDRLPTDAELKKLFCNPNTGVGTLGGDGYVFLDFDTKNYTSQEKCDADVQRIISKICIDANVTQEELWIERTGSGGWRIPVKLKTDPTFTNFSTEPNGKHIGEALGKGRFTVLAPSIHPNGNPYIRISDGLPVEVESLEAIGIYPSKDEVDKADRNQKREARKKSDPNYGKPTNPKDNPCDIRNFAHYFEGYHERSDGWAAAKCPHHNGTSQTSFRVHLETGATQLWCGCDPKDAYRSGLDLAIRFGYKLPKKDKTVTKDEWANNKLIRKVIKRAEWFQNNYKVASKKSQYTNNSKKEYVDYNQNSTNSSDVNKLKTINSDQVIRYPKGERKKVITALKQLGWKYILDSSFMGTGKSHDVGMFEPDTPESINQNNDDNEAGIKVQLSEDKPKLWYYDINHRNPSTGTIEQWTDVPTRNNGLVLNPDKTTPSGLPHRRLPQSDEVPITQSNCINADIFIKLRNKGYKEIEDKNETILDGEGNRKKVNPICKKCPFNFKCHDQQGNGYGYRYLRRQAFEKSRLRLSIDSAPSSGEYDFSKDTAYVEEASRSLTAIKTISASQDEISTIWIHLEKHNPKLHNLLSDVRLTLFAASEGEFKKIDRGIDRGTDHDTVISNRPSLDELFRKFLADEVLRKDVAKSFSKKETEVTEKEIILYIADQIESSMPKIEDLIEEPDSATGLGGKWRDIGEFTRRTMKKEAYETTKNNIDNAPINILSDILKVWLGISPGTLMIHNKKIELTLPNYRHANILKAHKAVILLDATADKRVLARKLDIEPNQIIEIQEELPDLSNLKVVNTNITGLGSNRISDACKKREEELLNAINTEHKGKTIKVLANKKDKHLPIDGWWFADNRGSNEFKGADVLVAFGTPRANMGVMQNEYRVMFGSLEGFEDYYQNLIKAEIIQLIGRPRAHHYPDKEILIYLVGTNQDASYLQEYGIQVTAQDAFNICPAAGGRYQQTIYKLREAAKNLLDQGQKVTQDGLASIAGITKGRISQIAKESWGGWAELKKSLVSLLDPYSKTKHSEGAVVSSEQYEAEVYLANVYIPLILEEEPEKALKATGIAINSQDPLSATRVLRSLPLSVQAKLLSLMMSALPQDIQQEIMEFAPNSYVNAEVQQTQPESTIDARSEASDNQCEQVDSEEEEQPTCIPKLGLRIEFSIAGETFFGELAASAPNDIWYILWDKASRILWEKLSLAYKRMEESIGESIPELPLTLKGNQLKLLRFDSEF